MLTRTKIEKVTFSRPFDLSGWDKTLPEGTYIVETEEELLEGLSFPAYRRKRTLIYLRPDPARPGRRQALPIDPDELDAALQRDAADEGSR
jgi:hypothetical protein